MLGGSSNLRRHRLSKLFGEILLKKFIPFFLLLLISCTQSPDLNSLYEAIDSDDTKEVANILSHNINLEPNCQAYQICKPLARASGRGNIELVKLLIEAGENPNGTNAYLDTAFITAENAASIAGKTKEDVRQIQKYLLMNGADPNQPNAFGFSPFIASAAYGDLEMMSLALENGAEVNAVFTRQVEASDPDNNSALMWAALQGQKDSVTFLLKHGADPSYKNTGGKIAIDWAQSKNHSDISEIISKEINNRF
jgi:ankyrin repeat protein